MTDHSGKSVDSRERAGEPELFTPALPLSIVVCTYNRPEWLRDCLATLAAQSLDPRHYEIIVVDNKPNDDTRRVTESTGFRCAHSYVAEPREGLSHARNRGRREAVGAYVAFIDDDCKVPSEWASRVVEAIERHEPAVLGGPYIPFYNSRKPRWYRDEYGSITHGGMARPLDPHEFLSGNNIVFRRDLLVRLGGFDEALGMTGNRVAYGEETALERYLRKTLPDARVWYDPALFVYHLVRKEKMRLRHIMRQRFAAGVGTCRVFRSDGPVRASRVDLLGKMIASLFAFGSGSTIGALFRNRTRFPCAANYLYERAFQHLYDLGINYEHLKRKGSKERVRESCSAACSP